MLINTVYLLRMVHEAGKQGLESFKPMGKVSFVRKKIVKMVLPILCWLISKKDWFPNT